MLTTKNIQFTAYTYFKTLLIVYLKKRWWFLLLIWLLALLMLSEEQKDSFQKFYIFFAFFYPGYLVARYWMYANSKDNKLFLLKRYFEIYEDKLVGFLSDGTESTIKIEHIVRVVELKNIYLLYIAQNQFIAIPKYSFKSNEDRAWFEQNILPQIKK